ncbi:2-deoxy-5-keto-D-gluconate 6-phosphate aldolase domain-containing protein [Phytoactinopolyspora endophytica]|uniref:2-deoxy-5-keto-D-gluconate 6-phosphate aldolase domain-containing protein n=1 Tax=Phytoactinopolyspora endophytica TaxID=1642495 RepID=UPI00101B8F37|nr:DUF2090 domain-containing protein [Phytoactinopolyspora endophytica]
MSRPDLFVLAVDQRPWLTQALYSHTRMADPDQRAEICRGKHMVLDGLVASIDSGIAVSPDSAAILVDPELGPGVAERARAHGITVSMPLEKAGLDVYEDEPDDVGAYLAHHRPDLAKVLVRYNPEGDREANDLQLRRLASTARAVRDAGSRFMFELLVPPTPEHEAATGGRAAYDAEVRPGLILRGMEEVSASVPVDVWKLEPLGAERDYAAAAERAASTGGECIVLGAGAPAADVETWVGRAARAGFSGFAVGRSIWWSAMRELLCGTMDHGVAVDQVAERYVRLVVAFRRARTPSEDVSAVCS